MLAAHVVFGQTVRLLLFGILQNMNESITVFTDGGARSNPGPSGVGISIVDSTGKPIKEFSKYIGEQTNNFAEYEAVALALEAIKKMYGTKTKTLQVHVKLDSELIHQPFVIY
jgi:ribonuclease HI